MQGRFKTVLACVSIGVAASAGASDIKWHSAYREGLAASKKSHRAVFVDFYADW